MNITDVWQSAEIYRGLSSDDKKQFIASMSAEEAYTFEHLWPFRARPKQIPPKGNWFTCLYLTGRGWGKTQTLTGWADMKAREYPGCRIAFVAPTAADARDVLVLGSSGVIETAPPWDRPRYSPTYRRIEWTNGSQAWLYSAEEAERLRGPQHHFSICDELRAWSQIETYDMLILGMRLGESPQVLVGTTPGPSSVIKNLLDDKSVPVISGSTFENSANLAKPYLEKILERYGGTRLGDQEIEGILLRDQLGALWKDWMFELPGFRVTELTLPLLSRKCVSIDPAVSTNRTSNETGIIVAGTYEYRHPGNVKPTRHFYVLDDRSMSAAPTDWAQEAVNAFREHECDFIVCEINNGGNLVSEMIAIIDPNIPVKTVHAAVSKEARAEPISVFYAHSRAHHYKILKELEDQMLDWIPGQGKSPDRVDALSWAGHALMLDEQDEEITIRQGRARFAH